MAWMGMPTDRGQMPGMATEEDLEKLRNVVGRRGRRVLRRADDAPTTRAGSTWRSTQPSNAESDEVRSMADFDGDAARQTRSPRCERELAN